METPNNAHSGATNFTRDYDMKFCNDHLSYLQRENNYRVVEYPNLKKCISAVGMR